jgi:hypothetical protein
MTMFSIPSSLVPAMTHVSGDLLFLFLLVVSLALIFAGGTLAKVLAFIVVGLVGAVFGGVLVAQYISPQWDLVGIFLGFVVGGLLGMALLPLGVGLVVGYAGYLLALGFGLSSTLALVAGVVFFIIGLVLSGKILKVVTAVAGGFLLFNVLVYFGLSPLVSTLVAAALTLSGLWVQLSSRRRVTKPAATNAGGQPSATR